MKHKLKLSFWALGILVLIMSQLFLLAPAQKASAQSLTIDSLRDKTHAFAVYTVWHRCLSEYDGTRVTNLRMNLNFGTNQKTYILGFARSDGDNNDGTIACSDAARLWAALAGYSDADTMMKDLGFTVTVPGCTSAPCTTAGVTYYELGKTTSKSSLPGKVESISREKGIATSLPTWGRYILSATAAEAKCQPSSTTGPGARANPTVSINVVGDDMGTLVSKTYDVSTSEIVPAYPNMSGGNNASCKYLTDDIKASATKFSSALVEDRITTAISLAETAICEQLQITNDREKQNCLSNFGSYLKTCIDDYYTGNLTSGTRSRADPFDTDYVATCVETKAKKAGYNISAEDISAILGDAQNQATPSTTPSSDSATDICDILGEEVPMKWMACAVLTAMNGIVNALYDMIQNLLYTPIDQTLASNQYNTSISNFRIFGMAFIFIIGLIMVIAQATGSEIVDAYTVRKVLPKLGIAIIGIAIAVPILKILITFTNDLGIMAGNFITDIAPTEVIKSNAVKSDAVGALVGTGTLGIIGILTAAVAIVAQGPAALTYIVVAVIALLIAFITLAMRQLVIIVLILFAPLAIAASALPGTEKLWKFWRGTLITTLMMFPIIMIFLKSGVFMASIFGNIGDQLNNQMYYLIAAVIFIAPYFMLPLAFKMAGGLVGNIFGMVNDRSKGLFDRMRNWRSNSTKRNMQAMREGTRFRERNGAWGKVNTALQTATNLDKLDPFAGNYKEQMRSWRHTDAQRRAAQGIKENPYFSAFAQDDTLLNAASAASEHGTLTMEGLMKELEDADKSGTRFKGPEHLKARQDAAALIMRARQTMGTPAFSRAVTLATPGTGTAYNDKRTGLNGEEETFTNYAQALRQINSTYGDDEVGRQSAIANLRSGLSGSGHAVGGVSMGAWISAANQVKDDPLGSRDGEINGALHESVARELAPGQGAQGKTYAVRENARGAAARLENFAGHVGQSVDDGYNPDGSPKQTSVTNETVEYEFARAAANLEAIGQTGGEAGDMYAHELQGAVITYGGKTQSVRDWITEMDNNPSNFNFYHQRKKAYANAYDRERGAPKPDETPPPPQPE